MKDIIKKIPIPFFIVYIFLKELVDYKRAKAFRPSIKLFALKSTILS